MLSRDKICAVVTTFNPTEKLKECLLSVSNQVGHVIIVDDTGTERLKPQYLSELKHTTYIQNNRNYGIAKSLNTGFNAAIEMDFEWVLTLDQDSVITPNYIDDILDFCNDVNCFENMVGIIALSRENQLSSTKSVKTYAKKRTMITSGSLTPISAYKSAGGFNNNYFIDLVDFDYCMKLRNLGLLLIQLPKPGMSHTVGDSTTYKFLGFNITIYNHSPFRLYYQVRNTFLFFKEYVFYDPVLSCYVFLDIFRIPFKTIFFEQEKYERLKYALRGLRDGLLGNFGRIDS